MPEVPGERILDQMSERESFHGEWMTVGDHRFLVESRDGPPSAVARRAAMLAVWQLELSHRFGFEAEDRIRLARVVHDNRHAGSFYFTFGVVARDDEAPELARLAVRAVEQFFDIEGGVGCEVIEVEPGDTLSDSYDQTEHLTLGALPRPAREMEGGS
jgi:hypothetical protein